MTDIDKISSLDEIDIHQVLAEIERAPDLSVLNGVRTGWLGRKGRLTLAMKGLGALVPEQRALVGARANQLKRRFSEAIDRRAIALRARRSDVNTRLIDTSLPGLESFEGSCHPISEMTRRIVDYMSNQCFAVVLGPEVEDDDHNFKWLNFEPDHPARTMHDSFYLERDLLLRTHTSSVQIRYMRDHSPPIRILAPGRVYRRDHDLTHSPMFTQIEGLVVDERVGIGELFAALNGLVQHIFGYSELKTRYRPSYFPFTEPSWEMDISCLSCSGRGCRICSDSGWLEVLGCGMVHPNVLNNVNIDSKIFNGYAFGLGVERLALLNYGIDDLRIFFENHLDFLRQFKPGA